MKRPIFVCHNFCSLFLNELILPPSVACWGSRFHLFMTRWEKKCLLRSSWQRCFSILEECPLVVVTELVVKRWSNGNSDKPLYILNTSSRSARLHLSSNVHNPRQFRCSSYCNDFSPGTICVKRCCTRSSSCLSWWRPCRNRVFEMGSYQHLV